MHEALSVPVAMTPWVRALWAVHLVAVDPFGMGGVLVRAGCGPVRDLWHEELTLATGGRALAKVPSNVDDQRLLGGLDLTATLVAGRPKVQPGLLTQADGGVLVVSMAERLSASFSAQLSCALDRGTISVERDGLSAVHPARIGLVLLDEGQGDDEQTSSALSERVGLWISLDGCSVRDCVAPIHATLPPSLARDRLSLVAPASQAQIEALVTTASLFGITSPRATLFAVRAARIICASAGRTTIQDDDVALAAAIVLAPRATCLPQDQADQSDETPPPPDDTSESEVNAQSQDTPLEDQVLEATRAALPENLLAALASGIARTSARRSSDGAGAKLKSLNRGRVIGTRAGRPGNGKRLALVESLRAAAPWQALRAQQSTRHSGIHIRPSDLHIRRHETRATSTIIFCVDASGSAAFARLAEVKGAVEMVLGQAYAARTQVALVAFRGTGAEVLVPPTRSLTRARRLLSSLPGGGRTPLVSGIDTALALGAAEKAKGNTPLILLLSDGRGNVARDGTPGRAQAAADLKQSAVRATHSGVAMVLVDTARWPTAETQALASSMSARYVPLPFADGAAMGALAGSLLHGVSAAGASA